MRLNVVKSVNKNWGVDCYVGKIRKNSFKIYYHSAYVKNSFNKTAYGYIIRDGQTTKIFYIMLSPFLNPIIYLVILVISLIAYREEIGTSAYITEVITLTKLLSTFPFFFGLISQIIPAPVKKEKIDILLKRVTEEEDSRIGISNE